MAEGTQQMEDQLRGIEDRLLGEAVIAPKFNEAEPPPGEKKIARPEQPKRDVAKELGIEIRPDDPEAVVAAKRAYIESVECFVEADRSLDAAWAGLMNGIEMVIVRKSQPSPYLEKRTKSFNSTFFKAMMARMGVTHARVQLTKATRTARPPAGKP